MPAYPLNPRPDARCDCGPALLCTHALVPIDTREIRIADTNSAGTTPAVPATKQVADPTNNPGETHHV
jgi:hypothetical protein